MICVLTFKGKGKGKVEDRLFGTDRLFVVQLVQYIETLLWCFGLSSVVIRDHHVGLLKRVNYILPS